MQSKKLCDLSHGRISAFLSQLDKRGVTPDQLMYVLNTGQTLGMDRLADFLKNGCHVTPTPDSTILGPFEVSVCHGLSTNEMLNRREFWKKCPEIVKDIRALTLAPSLVLNDSVHYYATCFNVAVERCEVSSRLDELGGIPARGRDLLSFVGSVELNRSLPVGSSIMATGEEWEMAGYQRMISAHWWDVAKEALLTLNPYQVFNAQTWFLYYKREG